MLHCLRSPLMTLTMLTGAGARAGAMRAQARARGRAISSTVHIKGLPVAIRREDLFTQCEGYGRIASLFINQSYSGKHSIVTVTFKSVGSAISIVDELDEMNMMGRKVSVKFSTRLDPPAPRSPPSSNKKLQLQQQQ